MSRDVQVRVLLPALHNVNGSGTCPLRQPETIGIEKPYWDTRSNCRVVPNSDLSTKLRLGSQANDPF